MTHYRNAALIQSPHHIDHPTATFSFTAGAAFLHQSTGVAHRIFDGNLIREKRQIGHNQRPFDTTAHRTSVMDHHIECYRQRGVVAQHPMPTESPTRITSRPARSRSLAMPASYAVRTVIFVP